MTTPDDTPDFPMPSPGFVTPTWWALKRWAGYDTGHPLTRDECRELRDEWTDAMHASGWVLAWVDPATGQIANKS